MPSILADWVTYLDFKKQATLLSGLRGPDAHAPAVKKLVKLLRREVQVPHEATHYLGDGSIPTWGAVRHDLESLPFHYVQHLYEALQVCCEAGVSWACPFYDNMGEKLFLHHKPQPLAVA